MKVLIYDTETGGLDPEKHSLFSIGALVGDLNTGEIIKTFEAFNKLPSVDSYVYTPKALEINGLTPTQAFNEGLETEKICDEFMDLWQLSGSSILGGHNEAFDRRFVSRQLYKITLPEFEANFTYRSLDTLPLVRLFTGNENFNSGSSLSKATKAFSIDMSDFGKNKFHTALFDAICCFRILHKFRQILTQEDVIERLVK